jgi:hypothetical protein
VTKRNLLPGLHVQWPWSELLLSGKKTVETRSYSIPKKYLGMPLALIETPGPDGRRLGKVPHARIIGTIVFSESFKYATREEWLKDQSRHQVDPADRRFSFSENKEKWGWVVARVSKLKVPQAPPKVRGIVFVQNCQI